MDFRTISASNPQGYEGFVTIEELREGLAHSQDGVWSRVPAEPGVYLLLWQAGEVPAYVEIGTGGAFKGRNPNVALEYLEDSWVPDVPVVYIGKASVLRRRLQQFMRFGLESPVAHWGGRYVWQLADVRGIVVCWKSTPAEDPREVERNLIRSFVKRHEKRPFANLTG